MYGQPGVLVDGSKSALAITGVAVLAAAGLIAFALNPAEPPRELSDSPSGGSVPVLVEQFSDARSTELVVELMSPPATTIRVGGMVTANSCVGGGVLVSGVSPASIDGVPLVALHTEVPLWRDLVVGSTTGEDVGALQAALVHIGESIEVTGQFDQATMDAFLRVQAADLPPSAGRSRLPASLIVWLPEQEVPVETCHAPMGTLVTPGEPLATLAEEVVSARLRTVPDDLIPGGRVVEIDGIVLGVDEAGVINPEGLAALSDRPVMNVHLASDGSVPLVGELRLADQIEVWSVPPSTVILHDSMGACVISADDGTVVSVEIVASRVGQSIVAAEHAAPAAIQLYPEQESC